MIINQFFWYDFFNIAFLGAMMLVFLFTITIYVYDRKPIYLYYSIYVLVVSLYLFSRSEFVHQHIINNLEVYLPKINSFIGFTFQYIAHLAALQFGIAFLDARQNYPIFYKAAYWVRFIFILAIILSIANISFINDTNFSIFLVNVERVIGTLAAIYFQIAILYQRKNKLVVFYITGTILFLIGAIVSVFAFDVVYMRIGTLLEILFFTLGLSYRSKIIQDERNLYKERMLEENREKQQILNRYNQDLKQQVIERSEALLNEQEQFEKEKQKVLKLSLEKEIDRVKITALRTQMKPHFLFNALNAIRALIIKNDPHQAYDYLTDFSRLVRYILESSEHDFVNLAEELKMLNVYIRLEQMRAEGNFDYLVEVSGDINPEAISIPPLIFQPFLENAIVHGIDDTTKEQFIMLKIISESKSLLRIEIQDNGKGRGNNRSENSFNELGKKKSMAVDLTQQRLSLLDSKNAKLEIVDLYLDNGAPAGTKVILHLPLIIDGKKVESSFNR